MEFNSSTGYKNIQTEIKFFLKKFEFKPYGSSTFFRVTEENILQFISFQKGIQSLNQQMAINFVLQGLFCPTCSFDLLQPGGRIGHLTNNKIDKWWPCDTEQATETSVNDIKETILIYVLPFFEKASTTKSICELIDNSEFDFIWSNYYTFIDKGFFYLKGNHYEKAMHFFQSKQPGKVSKFKTIKKLIEQHKVNDIENILAENVRHSKNKLKI